MVFANESCNITILNYSIDENVWTKKEVSGCSWVENSITSQDDNVVEFSKDVVIRIPYDASIVLRLNDYIVKGSYNGLLEDVLKEIDKYQHIQIKSVKLNKMGVLDHYRVNG